MTFTEDLAAVRPQFDPGTPFVAVLDATADVSLALGKLVEYVEAADFLEEFALRDEMERVWFGAKLAVALLSFQAVTQAIGDTVTDAFELVEA